MVVKMGPGWQLASMFTREPWSGRNFGPKSTALTAPWREDILVVVLVMAVDASIGLEVEVSVEAGVGVVRIGIGWSDCSRGELWPVVVCVPPPRLFGALATLSFPATGAVLLALMLFTKPPPKPPMLPPTS